MAEQEKEKKKGLKIVIIVLAVLLGLSLIGLAGTLVYNQLVDKEPASVTIPDNIITPDESDRTSSDAADKTESIVSDVSAPSANGGGQTTNPGGTASKPQNKADALTLHNKNTGDNQPFQVANMFPGDRETKYYCVRVSYHDTVTVRFRADIRPGYEKLAEVLKCKVTLLTTGETMYDGLMRDMPEALPHKLTADKRTTDELYYEITAYLDTGVGNEYMEKELTADFKWWVEEIDNLDPPKTGENSYFVPLLCVAAGSLLLLMILLFIKKREQEEAHNER